MKDDLNCSHNGGGDAYLLQSIAIHFNHTVKKKNQIVHVRVFLLFLVVGF